jgi:hypothetical protein
LPIAEDTEKETRALQRRHATLEDVVNGTLRLSAFKVLSQFIIVYLPELSTNRPEIEVELSFNHVNIHLSRREADLLL